MKEQYKFTQGTGLLERGSSRYGTNSIDECNDCQGSGRFALENCKSCEGTGKKENTTGEVSEEGSTKGIPWRIIFKPDGQYIGELKMKGFWSGFVQGSKDYVRRWLNQEIEEAG